MMSNQTVICVTESIRNVVSTTVHPLVIELNNTSLYQLRRRVTYPKEAFEALLYIVVSSLNLDIVPQNICIPA